MIDLYHRSREQQYAFDHIFEGESIQHIFQSTAQRLIDPLFKGFNGCVFAYGATGTGKTFTMLGNDQTPGLCKLSLQEIFQKKDELTNQVIDIMASYVEIYNEQIRDLLVQKDNQTYIDLRDNPKEGVILSGAIQVKVNSVDQVMNLLHQGNKRRTTEMTNANLTSSRSHAIFQIYLQISPKQKDTKIEQKISKLSLIDLAGSERGTATGNKGLRMREGAKINQSLLALANCINALGDKNRKGSFVPFRDSKLTRVLKDSLGGNCQTVMIVTVAPSSTQFEETLNTLKYANRAKNIVTKPIENSKLVQFHIAEYKNIIKELKLEIQNLKNNMKEPSQDIKEEQCQYCQCGREKDEQAVKQIKAQLLQNFSDRIQIRRDLSELQAQNQLNKLEIQEGQAKLIEYNIEGNVSKVVMKKHDIFNSSKQYPKKMQKQIQDIKKLQISVDLNQTKKKLMEKEMQAKTEQCQNIISKISQQVKHKDKRDMLELLIKNLFFQLENDELNYNLYFQEKLNLLLGEEIQRLRNNQKTQQEFSIDFESPEKHTKNQSFDKKADLTQRPHLKEIYKQNYSLMKNPKFINKLNLFNKKKLIESQLKRNSNKKTFPLIENITPLDSTNIKKNKLLKQNLKDKFDKLGSFNQENLIPNIAKNSSIQISGKEIKRFRTETSKIKKMPRLQRMKKRNYSKESQKCKQNLQINNQSTFLNILKCVKSVFESLSSIFSLSLEQINHSKFQIGVYNFQVIQNALSGVIVTCSQSLYYSVELFQGIGTFETLEVVQHVSYQLWHN